MLTNVSITATGNTYLVSTFAGNGEPGFADGTGTEAVFNNPSSLAIDRYDNLYVVDMHNYRIRKITPTGAVTTFAGSGAMGSADGAGSAASFNDPNGIAIDSNDNVYVAELGGNRIRRITPDGAVSTFAGSGKFGCEDGVATAASFFSPAHVAVDRNGNVFVADVANLKIRKITPSGVVSTFAGRGTKGSADGAAAKASFNLISGMNFDAAGNLYVADPGNNNIRKITRDGMVTTIAGGKAARGYTEGTGPSAKFDGCYCVAVDGNGFMYVPDQNNQVIRQITPEGAVTLLAGIPGSRGTVDGPALKAGFNHPVGIAIDSRGNIYVSEMFNHLIRKLTPQ